MSPKPVVRLALALVILTGSFSVPTPAQPRANAQALPSSPVALPPASPAQEPLASTIGAWTATSSLNTPRANLGAATWGNYVYALGGMNVGGNLDSVERAAINADGTLSAWTTLP